jgi:hypothetical protein
MRVIGTLLAALALFAARRARACPSCETALQARAALAERGDFWSQLLLILLPLVLMSVLAVALHGSGTQRASAESRSDTP